MTTIVLWADKFDETAEFYRLLLDGEFLNASLDFVSIVASGNEVLLHRVPAEWASEISNPPVRREENPIKPVFEVESIEEARAAIAGTSGCLFDASKEQTYGAQSYCDGCDPDGNIIQVASKTTN